MPRVRQHDRDRKPEPRDVAVERLEEPLLLPVRHERIDETHVLRGLDVGGRHLALVPLGMPRRPAPEPRPQLLHVHQKPKWTFVKYQNADVSHSPASTDAIVPPTTGSTQRGCMRSCTKKIFTAKTP